MCLRESVKLRVIDRETKKTLALSLLQFDISFREFKAYLLLPLPLCDFSHSLPEDQEREYLLRVSYLEIYNENIMDLLSPNSSEPLKVS